MAGLQSTIMIINLHNYDIIEFIFNYMSCQIFDYKNDIKEYPKILNEHYFSILNNTSMLTVIQFSDLD